MASSAVEATADGEGDKKYLCLKYLLQKIHYDFNPQEHSWPDTLRAFFMAEWTARAVEDMFVSNVQQIS